MKTEGKRNLLRQPDEIRLMTGGAQTEQETAPDAAAFRAGDVTVELAEADGSLVLHPTKNSIFLIWGLTSDALSPNPRGGERLTQNGRSSD